MAATTGDGLVHVPMRPGGWFNPSHRYFDPIFSTTLPLQWKEFTAVMDELNATMHQALPLWKVMPLALLQVVGFVLSVAGAAVVVSSGLSFRGPNSFAFVLLFLGFALFACGCLGGVFACMALSSSSMAALRGKLSELNAEYAKRGIDFQLVETRRLQRGYQDGHSRLRAVTGQTLVVQRLQPDAQEAMPPVVIV